MPPLIRPRVAPPAYPTYRDGAAVLRVAALVLLAAITLVVLYARIVG
jgi:hypothetical protein